MFNRAFDSVSRYIRASDIIDAATVEVKIIECVGWKCQAHVDERWSVLAVLYKGREYEEEELFNWIRANTESFEASVLIYKKFIDRINEELIKHGWSLPYTYHINGVTDAMINYIEQVKSETDEMRHEVASEENHPIHVGMGSHYEVWIDPRITVSRGEVWQDAPIDMIGQSVQRLTQTEYNRLNEENRLDPNTIYYVYWL